MKYFERWKLDDGIVSDAIFEASYMYIGVMHVQSTTSARGIVLEARQTISQRHSSINVRIYVS